MIAIENYFNYGDAGTNVDALFCPSAMNTA